MARAKAAKYVPWRYHGKTVGYERGGVFYLRRLVGGKCVRISTGCVTLEAANRELERFERDPEMFVSRLGRAPFPASDPRAVQRRANRIELRYRLSPEDCRRLLEAQGGRCAICGSPANGKALEIDHCHLAGGVRGLLCGRCNRGIGLLGDSPAILRAAIDYLERGREVVSAPPRNVEAGDPVSTESPAISMV